MEKLNKNQKGFVATLIVFFILLIMISITLSMSSLIFHRQRIVNNVVKSTQAYYTSESGIEDSLLRLNNNPLMPSASYNLNINNSTANVVIPAMIGGARSISSQGNNSGLVKTTEVVYAIDGEGASFFYGAQVGAGGLIMSNSSRIIGSIFSNGNIVGSGIATIDNDVIVAGNGHSISGMRVKGNVFVYSCNDSTIDGNLTYVLGGTNNCAVGGTTSVQSSEIASQPLPISQSQIDDWKSDAEAGGIISSVTLSG